MTFRDEIRPVIAAILENGTGMEAAKAEYCKGKGGYSKKTWDSEVKRQENGWQPTQKKEKVIVFRIKAAKANNPKIERRSDYVQLFKRKAFHLLKTDIEMSAQMAFRHVEAKFCTLKAFEVFRAETKKVIEHNKKYG